MTDLMRSLYGVEVDSPDEIRRRVEGSLLPPNVGRRALAAADQWDSNISQTILGRVEHSLTVTRDNIGRAAASITMARRQIAQISADAVAGRVTRDEALHALKEERARIASARDVLAQCEASRDRALGLLDMDSAEFLEAQRTRFPATADANRLFLSVAFLEGDAPSPVRRGGA